MDVRLDDGMLEIFPPLRGEPAQMFTVEAAARSTREHPAPPVIRPTRTGIRIDAGQPLRYLLVRVPSGVTLHADVKNGDIVAQDVSAPLDLVAHHGSVRAVVYGYAQARTDLGDLSVSLGAASWPGTLHFETRRGNVTLWVEPGVAFRVRLHTDGGAIYTTFPLRGRARGTAETIEGTVGAGAPARGFDVRVGQGDIRLLEIGKQP